MKRLALLLLAPLAILTGCTRDPAIATPDDFAELDGGAHHAYRATNASGVVVGVRSEKNDPKGNLDFWSQALANKLEKGGYKKVGSDLVTTSAGIQGRRLKYEIDKSGRISEYWITIFVTAKDVVVVEAGGDSAFFDEKTEKQVDQAIKSLELG